jgi:hypothetical protein
MECCDCNLLRRQPLAPPTRVASRPLDQTATFGVCDFAGASGRLTNWARATTLEPLGPEHPAASHTRRWIEYSTVSRQALCSECL